MKKAILIITLTIYGIPTQGAAWSDRLTDYVSRGWQTLKDWNRELGEDLEEMQPEFEAGVRRGAEIASTGIRRGAEIASGVGQRTLEYGRRGAELAYTTAAKAAAKSRKLYEKFTNPETVAAKAAFLRLPRSLRNPENLPHSLFPHFTGVSVQDLIDTGNLPAIGVSPVNSAGARSLVLDLSNKYINDASGLENVPNKERINFLRLNSNLLTSFDLELLDGFTNIRVLNLAGNPLSTETLAELNATKPESLTIESEEISTPTIAPPAPQPAPTLWFPQFFWGPEHQTEANQATRILAAEAKRIFLTLRTLDANLLPERLYHHFTGVSIDDLVTARRLPAIANGILDLSNKSINSLTGIERIQNKESVTHLLLDHNRLTSIPSTAFNDFINLVELDLSDNQLETLHSQLIRFNNQLQRVNLSRNQLIILPRDFFSHTSLLKNIDLSHNRFYQIDSLTFDGLDALETLEINNNNLQELTGIPVSTVLTKPSLVLLNLQNNNFPPDDIRVYSTLISDARNENLVNRRLRVFF